MDQDDVDSGRKEGLTSEERAELVRLRRENRVQAMEIEILKRASAYLPGRTSSQNDLPGGPRPRRKRCRCGLPGGHVPLAGSNDWLHRQVRISARAAADALLTCPIAEIHDASRGCYGSPRVHAELRLGLGPGRLQQGDRGLVDRRSHMPPSSSLTPSRWPPGDANFDAERRS
jgi:hypothetical protein